MIPIEPTEFKKLKAVHGAMDEAFAPWRPHFQELAQYLLPRRYVWLAERSPLQTLSQNRGAGENRASKSRNKKILDPTGTSALRDLAAGMMNGITSPTRPWLRLREAGYIQDPSLERKAYFEEVARRMLRVMAESNFYNSIAIVYLEHAGFGTAACLIYEDFDEVIRCYNAPLGEFRLSVDYAGRVNGFSRAFVLTVQQVVQEFGIENVSDTVRRSYEQGREKLFESVVISHLLEENKDQSSRAFPSRFAYREFYWEAGDSENDRLLQKNGYEEKPGIFARWEITGNDIYGTSPGMDALADIIQLQHETLRKAQVLDKVVKPPIVVESSVPGKEVDLLPGGVTMVGPSANFGAKPVFTVNPPLGELTRDIQAIQLRIREIFHNDLFRMISNLDTVRSATEIDARREEKLVLLGGVLERFENEALDPAVKRIFKIMQRRELLPEPPPDVDIENLEIEYVSILSDAQRAIGTASIERFTQFYGNLVGVDPALKASVNMDEILRDYGDRLNITSTGFYTRDERDAALQQEAELQQSREAALVGKDLTDAARNLSETEVGGGRKALDILLGG